MVRTIVSLSEEDKKWLDRAAKREKVPMTVLIRRAVSLLRSEMRGGEGSFDDALDRSRGIWAKDEGLRYQRGIRDEW